MRGFIDGTGLTPGSESCRCGKDCEFPCWQRIGIAPSCVACECPPFPDEQSAEDEISYAKMLEEIKPDDKS
jgi:hypothetical protein